jgi:hypothetical protein
MERGSEISSLSISFSIMKLLLFLLPVRQIVRSRDLSRNHNLDLIVTPLDYEEMKKEKLNISHTGKEI